MAIRGLHLWSLVGVGALSIAASELWHRRASGSGPGRDAPATTRSCAVVVLGFPARRGGDLHALQRWRTEIGIRSLGSAPDRRLVFTGGPSRGAQVSEAQVMADYARRRGVPAEGIVLEEAATNTWENLTLAVPLIEAFDTIIIASDPLHAWRSRRYLARQDPTLVEGWHSPTTTGCWSDGGSSSRSPHTSWRSWRGTGFVTATGRAGTACSPATGAPACKPLR
jgi:uncharacterized SAM-binding protein YcdF (DUF218 family)